MNILDRIMEVKRAEVAASRRQLSLEALQERATAAPAPRDFVGALRTRVATGRAAVIAEIKRASPSKGVLRADFDPVSIAGSYEKHGAACMSVLTDKEFFQGSEEHLKAAPCFS